MGYVLVTRQWVGPAAWAFSYFIRSWTGRLKPKRAIALLRPEVGACRAPSHGWFGAPSLAFWARF